MKKRPNRSWAALLTPLALAALGAALLYSPSGFFRGIPHSSGGTASWKLSQVCSASSTAAQVYPAR